MESDRSVTAPTSATSRRAMRDRTRPASSSRQPWLPRAVVLMALAAATIVVPVIEAVAPQSAAAGMFSAAGLPNSYEVLSGSVQQTTPTTLLAAVPAVERVSEVASRSFDRDPLPGCDGVVTISGTNGQLPDSDLCPLWDGVHKLRPDAAVALSELNRNFNAAYGRDLCITDSYRTLASQRRLAATRPGLAATPEKSNHGWGLAIDLCGSDTRSDVLGWLFENGPTYGWVNPRWAQRGGGGPYEPWHWEYLPGTIEMGTDYS